MRFGAGDSIQHTPTGAIGKVVDTNVDDDTLILEQGQEWLKEADCELVEAGINRPQQKLPPSASSPKPNPAAEKHPSLGGLAVDEPKHAGEQAKSDAVRNGFQVGDKVSARGRLGIVAEVNDAQKLVHLDGDKNGRWYSYNDVELQERANLSDVVNDAVDANVLKDRSGK